MIKFVKTSEIKAFTCHLVLHALPCQDLNSTIKKMRRLLDCWHTEIDIMKAEVYGKNKT